MTRDARRPTSLGQAATLACVWEATASKPGNVYRAADFADMSYADMVTAAVALGPVFDNEGAASVGEMVYDAVHAMRGAVAVNTHLGTILLLAPLSKAAATGREDFARSADAVARATTVDDARLAYEAIRSAAPGGLGRVDQSDVAATPQVTLYEAMRLAADRDTVARQYVEAFADVFAIAAYVADDLQRGEPLGDAIVHAHVRQMAARPDSLIERKCGREFAREAADRAGAALASGRAGDGAYEAALADLDFWLRADGHQRNPGTTADLVAAALFVLIVEEKIEWPVRFYERMKGEG